MFSEPLLGERVRMDSLANLDSIMGQENRTQILPSKPIDSSDFVLPKYDFAGELKAPDQVGVRRDDTMESVVNAAKGMMYYTDMIGFGESSSPFTRGMDFQRLGINFFIPSGLRCSNGADMWTYFQGIPDGTGLGERIKVTLERMDLPAMRGLAPGILEDTKAALNPQPLMQAAFGNVYPVCQKVTLPVGDEKGKLGDGTNVWIKQLTPNDIIYKNGMPHQERWVQAMDKEGNPVFITQEEWNKTPKTLNSDGTPAKQVKEGFEDKKTKENIVFAIVLLSLAFGLSCSSK